MPSYPLGPRIGFKSLREWCAGAVFAADLIGMSVRKLERATPNAARQSLHPWARRLFDRLDLSLEIRGLPQIGDGPYIVAPLHEGFFDVPALLHLPLALRFTATRELAEWPRLGRGIAATEQIIVDGQRPITGYRNLLRDGERAIRDDDSVVVFPQGSVLGIEVSFQRGAEGLAQKLGVPILPVVITGSHTVWDYPFSPTMGFGRSITMEILPPRDTFGGVEDEMRSLALDGHRAPPRRFNPERDGWWDDYSFEISPDFSELRSAVLDRRAAIERQLS